MSITDYLAIGLVVTIQTAGMVVLFMMITRRGWWKDPEIGYDWTTTDGCHICWEYGPFWSPHDERVRDIHQAQHAIVAILLRPVARLIDRWSGATRDTP